MHSALVHEVSGPLDAWAVARSLVGTPGMMLLESQQRTGPWTRYSLLVGRPFLQFRSFGSRCELERGGGTRARNFGNPWQVLAALFARYELPDQPDLPFPVGGCFGFWGYSLTPFAEPAVRGLKPDRWELPDCQVGFHDSVLVFDHELSRTWIVASGLRPDGTRERTAASQQRDRWRRIIDAATASADRTRRSAASRVGGFCSEGPTPDREAFLRAVAAAQRYIRQGHIYQVNLSRRIEATTRLTGVDLFEIFRQRSPAPFALFMDGGGFQLASHSPELFLRMSGHHGVTRPIKGTRPRSADRDSDQAALSALARSAKEQAELLMITDLLRNDLGRICEFGSVHVPELRRLEAHGAVHHAVSTVEGRLRPGTDHLHALRSCFPGGSVTGAPKIRAVEIINELEPVGRGPYTGCGGYLGFNRETQLSVLIRTAVSIPGRASFHAGAGIVADSEAASEFEETEAKAVAFRAALQSGCPGKTAATPLGPVPVLIES